MRWMYACTLQTFWPTCKADPWAYVVDNIELVTEVEEKHF
jgi:hypothetical protein